MKRTEEQRKERRKLMKRESDRKYRLRHKEWYKEYFMRRHNTEKGYFRDQWSKIINKKQNKHGHNFKNFDDFFQCWLDQKAIHGMTCPATGVKMTRIRGNGYKQTPTNISRDRILSNKGYPRQNLIFTTWRYNKSKNDLSPEDAKAFLRIVKERYGTDEVERDET